MISHFVRERFLSRLSSAEAVTTVTPAAAADIQVNEPGMQLVVVVS